MAHTKSAEQWVGLDQATQLTEGRVMIGNLGLPSVLSYESMQINAHAIEGGVIGWGGAERFIVTSHDGDKDSYDVGVAGGSGDTVFAAASKLQAKAESSIAHDYSDGKKNAHHKRNGSIIANLNSTALNDRLRPHEQIDPVIRAAQLDTAIKRAAIRGVYRHNMVSSMGDVITYAESPRNYLAPVTDGFLFVLAGIGVIVDLGVTQQPAVTVGVGVTMSFLSTLDKIRGMMDEGDYSFRDRIYDPLFSSVRPTRAAVAAVALQSSKIIRPTPA